MDRSAAREFFRDRIAMAPMAMGGNLPYRRLCREFGAELTCSEMILADKLVRRSRAELPLLRHHASEETFGVQLCGKRPEIVAEAARIAVEHGAVFIDLNFGCPIDVVVRKGAGAALLRRPKRLGEVVSAVREAVDLPLSVKIRAGWSSTRINAVAMARLIEDCGADAVGVHGRTRQQRYRRAADWELIAAVADEIEIPVLGNGDILTPWDMRERLAGSRVSSVLIARGALIKPWIFRELADGEPHDPSVADRWAVLRRYYEFATEYFGDDEKGQQRVRRFFLWHWDFWHRYRSFSRADFEAARPEPLIQTRNEPVVEQGDASLLASPEPADHELILSRIVDRDFPTA